MRKSEREQVEAEVAAVLKRHRIARLPVDLEAIAAQEKIIVQHTKLPVDVSGFLYKDDSHQVIGVNAKHPIVRQRFTIAHEIGHLLLGHAKDKLHIDRDNAFALKMRDGRSTAGTDREEIQANAFAAALLMPKSLIFTDIASASADISDDDFIVGLARKYRVSLQALTIRLNSLGVQDVF